MDISAISTFGASAVAAATASVAAWNSWQTRISSHTPPPVPVIFDFVRFNSEQFDPHYERFQGAVEHGDALFEYRLSLTNDGTRAIRVLDMGYQMANAGEYMWPALGPNRSMKEDGRDWAITSVKEVPVTIQPGEGIESSFTVSATKGEEVYALIGKAFVEVGGQEIRWKAARTGLGS